MISSSRVVSASDRKHFEHAAAVFDVLGLCSYAALGFGDMPELALTRARVHFERRHALGCGRDDQELRLVVIRRAREIAQVWRAGQRAARPSPGGAN